MMIIIILSLLLFCEKNNCQIGVFAVVQVCSASFLRGEGGGWVAVRIGPRMGIHPIVCLNTFKEEKSNTKFQSR